MSTTVRSKEKMSRSKVITLSACVAALAAAVTGVAMIASLNGKEYTAKTMRLLRAEGTVYLVDASGANLPAMDNVRFKSGDALSTGADGLASIGLDESKVVTLRQDSRAEFVKSRKSLELNLTQGELYFNVKEHLADDETFDIRTSTMSVGIRGTSGYVYYDEEGRQNVLITDGCVHVEATNPTTGEAGQIEVSGGHCATVNIYEDRETDSLEFTMTDVAIDDLPDFVVETIANDEELLGRVCEYNGWSRNDIIEAAEQIENADEEKQGVEQTEATAETSVETSETTAESKVETAVEPTATPKPTATPAPTRAPRSNVTPAPTAAAPTTAPTATPTAKPTAAPTATPTQAPQSNSNNSSSSSSTSNEPASTTVPTVTPTATPTPEATVTEPTQTSEQTPATEETHETTEDNNQDNVPAQQPVDQTVNEAPASSIPDIREEDLPAGYEMWLWDEANGHFMMAGVKQSTNEFEWLGYLQGEWINLYEKTYGVGGIEGFAYCYTLPTGEEIIYCTTEDMQNCTTNFYDIMAERRAEEERLAAEQAAAEQAASDYWKDDSQDPNISDYPVTSAHDMNHGDDWRTGGNPY